MGDDTAGLTPLWQVELAPVRRFAVAPFARLAGVVVTV